MKENAKEPTLLEQLHTLCLLHRSNPTYYWVRNHEDRKPRVVRIDAFYITAVEGRWIPEDFARMFPDATILGEIEPPDITPPAPEHRVTVWCRYLTGDLLTDAISVNGIKVSQHPNREWVVSSWEVELFLAIRDTQEQAEAVAEKIRATPNGGTVTIEHRLPKPATTATPATAPSPTTKPDCGSCRFYEVNEGNPRVGNCHRYPPIHDGWTVVAVGDFCGEFQPTDTEGRA